MTRWSTPGDPTLGLPCAYGKPVRSGRTRVQPEDFQVDEILGYEASGAGEHVFLALRKRNLNTQDLVCRIARLAGVAQKDIGFAGLKDRVAVTTQAFSVRLAGKPVPDWSALEGDDVQVLRARPHNRKIRRGSLRGNRFRLRLRDIDGRHEDLEGRLAVLSTGGVPNYFGPQRFGIEGRNLQRAHAFFGAPAKRLRRDQRSLLLSAARSWLFNHLLAERVWQQNWNRPLPGDVYQLDGAPQTFVPASGDPQIATRVNTLDIHPTGPLAGRASRAKAPTDEAAQLERRVLADYVLWTEGLARAGVEAGRRALRAPVRDLDWSFDARDLHLSFTLDAGAYATVVLRELIKVSR